MKAIDLKTNSEKHWAEVIEPSSGLLNIQLDKVWQYRDLLVMFVKRDIVATYKQTILGPIWFFIQPLLTSVIFMVIFGHFAKISTDGTPMILFYLSGVTAWNYFSESLNKTATVFKDNSAIFGKVYFPRLILPLSIIVSNLVKFGIQFGLFLVVFLYYYCFQTVNLKPNIFILFTPVLIFIIAGLSLGFGMIISALTTKYRDLIFLLTFGIQLLMYATPVIYPLSSIPEKYQIFVQINPMTSIIESFRFAYFGSGEFSWFSLLYSFLFMIVIVFFGTLIFNKVEKGFMDTV